MLISFFVNLVNFFGEWFPIFLSKLYIQDIIIYIVVLLIKMFKGVVNFFKDVLVN